MKPCCFSLIIAVQIVAVVSVLFDSVGLTLYILELNSIAISVNADDMTESSQVTAFGIILLVLGIVGSVIHFALSSILFFIGARQRSVSKCRLWCYATLVLLVLMLMILANLPGWKLIVAGVMCLIQVYDLWIVYAFTQEIKNENSGSLTSSTAYTVFI